MTNSLLPALVGSQTPRVANFPPYPLSAAPEVIDLAAACGLHLDEWQQYVLTHGLGQRVDDMWTAPKVSVWVPRQNGKGAVIEALELAWLFLFDEELIVHSAHQHRTSQKAYDRLEKLIRRTPDLHRLVRQYRQANGEQQIELLDGRMLQYTTRSRTAVRGFSANKLVLDEAQELTSEQMAAILPTVSAMHNWQVWFFGTPPDDPGAWVYGLREDGENGAARLAHFDWGADLNLEDPDDREKVKDRRTWYDTNPALGVRIALETVEDECKPSGLGDKFGQERLGVWKPRATAGAGVIPDALWAELADPMSIRPAEVAFAIDVSPDRQTAAIVAAGYREDGRALLSVVDHRPGTDWIPDRAATLKSRWNPLVFAVDGKSPAAAQIDQLGLAGITPPVDADEPRRGDLIVMNAGQAATAWGLFVDAARHRLLAHLDEAPMSVALAGAKIRNLGDGSAWARRGGVDITPLVAATEAYWALLTFRDIVCKPYDALANIW